MGSHMCFTSQTHWSPHRQSDVRGGGNDQKQKIAKQWANKLAAGLVDGRLFPRSARRHDDLLNRERGDEAHEDTHEEVDDEVLDDTRIDSDSDNDEEREDNSDDPKYYGSECEIERDTEYSITTDSSWETTENEAETDTEARHCESSESIDEDEETSDESKELGTESEGETGVYLNEDQDGDASCSEYSCRQPMYSLRSSRPDKRRTSRRGLGHSEIQLQTLTSPDILLGKGMSLSSGPAGRYLDDAVEGTMDLADYHIFTTHFKNGIMLYDTWDILCKTVEDYGLEDDPDYESQQDDSEDGHDSEYDDSDDEAEELRYELQLLEQDIQDPVSIKFDSYHKFSAGYRKGHKGGFSCVGDLCWGLEAGDSDCDDSSDSDYRSDGESEGMSESEVEQSEAGEESESELPEQLTASSSRHSSPPTTPTRPRAVRFAASDKGPKTTSSKLHISQRESLFGDSLVPPVSQRHRSASAPPESQLDTLPLSHGDTHSATVSPDRSKEDAQRIQMELKVIKYHTKDTEPNMIDIEILQLMMEDVKIKPKNPRPNPSARNEVDGYIYVFSFKHRSQYCKIGSTNHLKVREKCVERCMGPLTRSTEHDAEQCAFRFYQRAEQLAHVELQNERRKVVCEMCPRRSNGKAKEHGEWFEVSEERALAVTRKWRRWITRCKPYSESEGESEGMLKPEWMKEIRSRRSKNWSEKKKLDDWLETVQAALESRDLWTSSTPIALHNSPRRDHGRRT